MDDGVYHTTLGRYGIPVLSLEAGLSQRSIQSGDGRFFKLGFGSLLRQSSAAVSQHEDEFQLRSQRTALTSLAQRSRIVRQPTDPTSLADLSQDVRQGNEWSLSP
jgi:hypothetical protein